MATATAAAMVPERHYRRRHPPRGTKQRGGRRRAGRLVPGAYELGVLVPAARSAAAAMAPSEG